MISQQSYFDFIGIPRHHLKASYEKTDSEVMRTMSKHLSNLESYRGGELNRVEVRPCRKKVVHNIQILSTKQKALTLLSHFLPTIPFKHNFRIQLYQRKCVKRVARLKKPIKMFYWRFKAVYCLSRIEIN